MRLFILLVLYSGVVSAMTEGDYVDIHCKGEIEHRLPDKARVDCLMPDYAIEYDHAKKWGEAVGQALYYASQTNRKPGIALIVGPSDWRYVERLFEAIQKSDTPIRVWFVRK